MSIMGKTMPAGCWDLDLATGELKLCPHSRRLFGLSPDTAELLSESEWVERFHPKDLSVVREAMRACIDHQRPYAERFRTIHPDGTTQTVLGIGCPVYDEHGRGHFIGWNFDPVFAADIAGDWIAEHPEALRAENRFSISLSLPTAKQRSLPGLPPDPLLERAKSILRVRRSRERLLGRAMIGDPGFDLLLHLYVQQGQQQRSLTSLAQAAGIPYSSAMRWIAYLGDKDLIEREQSGHDRRSMPVRLTLTGRAVMDELLAIR